MNHYFYKSLGLKIFLWTLLLSAMFLVSSCGLFHGGRKSDAQAQSEMQKRQNKAIDEQVKIYDKKYTEQLDRQAPEKTDTYAHDYP